MEIRRENIGIFLTLDFYRHQPLEFLVLDLLDLMPQMTYT